MRSKLASSTSYPSRSRYPDVSSFVMSCAFGRVAPSGPLWSVHGVAAIEGYLTHRAVLRDFSLSSVSSRTCWTFA
jgi:hypothetical protein